MAADTPRVMFCVVKVLPHLTTIVQPDVSDFGQTNGEADQRRTIGSAVPLDHVRRLIQRLVPGHVVAWSSHRHPTTG